MSLLSFEEAEESGATVPRSYQMEMFQKAMAGNVIAVLDTGSGKTLISCLIIKHMHNIDFEKKQSKISWDEARWQNELAEVDVIVLTPDVFRHMLDRSFVKMSMLNLIVFDEAHYARGNHAYKVIMSQHYMHSSCRPKIFGMTASPLISKENTEDSIRILEKNLMSKAHTCKVSDFVSRPKEYIQYYDQAPRYDFPRLYLKMIDVQAGCIPQLSRAMTHASVLCDELGPWPAERILELSIHDAATKLKYSRFQRNFNNDKDLEEMESIVEQLDQYIVNSTCLGDSTQSPTRADISPKVLALLNVLEKFRPTRNRFCGIVFCRQRWTACVLAMVVKYWRRFDWVRPGVIVGHGSSDSTTLNMSIQGQDDIMAKFRNGQINLLFATQVAEEGLDIQSCILVIRFDMFANLAAYIQSRGRARHKNSVFVVLSKKSNPEEASLLACMQLEEANMRKILYDEKGKSDKDLELSGSPMNRNEIFTIESTGSCISVHSALSLLHNYCSSLPNDGYTVSKPEFSESEVLLADENESEGCITKKYISKLILPLNTPVECRTVIGKPAKTKKKARQWTAFEAVQRLFFVGELDDRLRPNRPDRLSIIQNTTKKPKTIEVHECIYRNPILFGDSWDNVHEAILHVLSIEEGDIGKKDLRVGLLTPSNIPIPSISFDFLMEGKKVRAFVRPRTGKIKITAAKLGLIRQFHYNIFSSILRSNFNIEDKFTLLVVPIQANPGESEGDDILDMNLIYSLDKEPKTPLNELCKSVEFLNRDFSDLVLYDHVHYKRKYFIYRLLDQYTPYSEDIPLPALGKHKSPADYYKYRLQFKGDILKDQPIFSVAPVTLPFLTVPAIYHDRPDTFVIPQFCVVHPVPASIMRYEAPRLPLILYHLHHNMLALETKKGWIPKAIQSESKSNFRKELPVKLDTLRVAMTGPCVELSYDYERLETLGDSFLKMHLALHYFVFHPNRHEGWLTVARHAVERNTHLQAMATLHDIQGTILFHRMKRSDWFPPLTSRKRTQYLPDKCVADVVEAIIGACVVDSRELGGATAVHRYLGEEFKFDLGDYSQIWKKHFKKSESQRNRVYINRMKRTIQKIEDQIEYKFNDYRYAVEAITHPSSLGPNVDGIGFCYQRLEYLGDAILGYIIMHWLYHRYPEMTPRLLTEYRSALVNNQFLATVACSLDLHKHLDHMSSPLAKSLMLFSDELEKKLDILKSDLGWIPRKKAKDSISKKNLRSADIMALALERNAVEVSQRDKQLPDLKENDMYGEKKCYSDSISAPRHDQVIVIDDDDSADDSILDELFTEEAPGENKVVQYHPTDSSFAKEIIENENLDNDVIILDSEDTSSHTIKVEDKGSLIKNFDLSDYQGEIIDIDGIDDTSLELCVNEVLCKDQAIQVEDFVDQIEPQDAKQRLQHPLSDGIELLEEAPTRKQNTDSHGLKPFFWDDLICAPKAAGDIYEALLGAIYLDSGFSIQAVYTVIEKTLINRWWSRFELSRSFNNGGLDKNPISDFLTIINKDLECTLTRIRFEVDLVLNIYECNISFHSRLIGTCTAETRKDAKRGACRMAADYLKETLKNSKKECRCRYKTKDVTEPTIILRERAPNDIIP